MFNLVVIGHIAKDVIIRNGSKTYSIGGPPFYAGVAARKMGGNVGIVSKIGKDFDDASLAVFKEAGIQTSIMRTEGLTTSFELAYLPEGRRLKLAARCEPILFEDVPGHFLETESLLISPIAGEISLDFMKKISRNTGSLLGIDAQGFVRKFDAQGNVYFDTWRESEQILPLVDIVKFSKREALTAMNCENIYEAAQKILNFGSEIVIITLGEEGVLIRGKENLSLTPKTSQDRVVETTGAGDIFFGVFLLEYTLTKNVKTSARVATIAASKSTERKGMSRFITRDQIESDYLNID
ncbi:MAG: PfkB family carbohydrate kinase [Candidatus Jordarchaeaceae archaeon]